MSAQTRSGIELVEYATADFAADEIADECAERLYHEYGSKIDVQEPGFRNQHRWNLTSKGWVGWLSIGPDDSIRISPRTPIRNLLGMLEYAYDLFSLEADIMGCQTLEELFESLAFILASRVIDRTRKGLYREYVGYADDLPYLRGRLDTTRLYRNSTRTTLPCEFAEHTADIEENRILATTLRIILLTGICTERTLPTVRKAYRTLRGTIGEGRYTASACLHRIYNRLNVDYRPLHALCRFFLEFSGPSERKGPTDTLPFLIDMAHLFELFVARWFEVHLPPEYLLKRQDSFRVDDSGSYRFTIDISLFEKATSRCIAVIDTKYKIHPEVQTADLHQIISYAAVKRVSEGILVYPCEIVSPINSAMGEGDIRVRTLRFPIDGDLEEGGRRF